MLAVKPTAEHMGTAQWLTSLVVVLLHVLLALSGCACAASVADPLPVSDAG